MKRRLIYQTLFTDKTTGELCVYIGSHTTEDDLWPEKGCKDPYIGSCSIAMRLTPGGKFGCTRDMVKERFTFEETIILQEVKESEESILGIEGLWIYDAYAVYGIHPLAREAIARRCSTHPLLKFKEGTCLNCHKNSDKFLDTDYYKEWLKGQGYRSALGNSKEARMKALITRSKHIEDIRAAQSKRMAELALTEKGKEFYKRFTTCGNSPEARKKAMDTRISKLDKWVCKQRQDLGPMPIRYLGIELGLGRGAQQCWSRLGKPNSFEFKGYLFDKV